MPVINTNTTANSALRYLNINSSAQSSSVSKIASGSRITTAGDDASGLAVATSLKSDVTVLKQASTNASNATSILQTADGTMSNIADILQRMRSLATQSLSGTVTDTERTYLQAEYSQLYTEVDSISSGTRFNDQSLMDGSADSDWSNGKGVTFRVGTTDADVINVKIANTTTSTAGLALSSATVSVGGTMYNGASVATTAAATAALTKLNAAVVTLSDARSNVGAQMSRFEFRASTIDQTIENTQAAESDIEDVDVAEEQSNLATQKVKTQAAIAVLSQANQMGSDLLSLLR